MPVATPVAEILGAPVGATIYGDGGASLIIAQREGEGLGEALRVTATADGRPVIREWHQGPNAQADVFYETYTRAGRVSHGWVSEHSRKLVQVG